MWNIILIKIILTYEKVIQKIYVLASFQKILGIHKNVLNVQVVNDATNKIKHIVSRWLGRFHDGNKCYNSHLTHQFWKSNIIPDDSKTNFKCNKKILLSFDCTTRQQELHNKVRIEWHERLNSEESILEIKHENNKSVVVSKN